MAVKCSEIIQMIEMVAPKNLAESWDNVGLQIGSYKKQVNRILLTLDVTETVVLEAIEKKADLIISHHPFIFNGLKSICTDEQKGHLVAMLIKNDIALYAAHTNLDKAELGLNDYIAKKLEIDERLPLEPSDEAKLYKIVVYVPTEYTDKIIRVLGENGAGFIGNYSHCTYRTVGEGTFKPLDGTTPFIGKKGEMTKVEEDRIETIINDKMMKTIIQKLKAVHPYEEMAYDVYPLENGALLNKNGSGKIGLLKEAVSPEWLIEKIKNTLQLEHIRAAGNPPEKIRKVALCTGSGAEFMGLAKVKKADVYITGDLKYHDAQRADENNLWVIDAGHFGTEKMVVNLLEEMLKNQLFNQSVEFLRSEKNEDFMRYY
ncbi:MAG: Nif3-like dinuclear metal center hexameric protein [Eubacterium sp.]